MRHSSELDFNNVHSYKQEIQYPNLYSLICHIKEKACKIHNHHKDIDCCPFCGYEIEVNI